VFLQAVSTDDHVHHDNTHLNNNKRKEKKERKKERKTEVVHQFQQTIGMDRHNLIPPGCFFVQMTTVYESSTMTCSM
jgi:hypothetical protein